MDSEALSTEASPRDLSEAPLDNTATTSDTEQTAMEDSQSSPQIAVEPMLIETTETEDTIVVDTGESPQTIGPTSTTDTTEKTNATEEIIVEEAALASNTIPAAVAPQAIAEPTAEPAGETEEPAKPILSKKVCGICNEKQAKYKCSRCALPFCSVACSAIHKSSHPALEPAPSLPPKSKSEAKAKDPRPGTVAAAGHKSPFAALEGSPELKELFKIYPRLPALLDEIDKRTLQNASSSQNNGGHKGGFRRKEEPWTVDVGLKKGVEALNQARNSSNSDGKSLREYSRLVLQILAGESEPVSDLIRKELAEENARVIQQLLQGER